MNVAAIQARIAARKALGLTAAEYNARIGLNLEMAKANVTRAICNCIKAGLVSDIACEKAELEYNTAKAQLAKAIADQEAGIIS